MTFHPPIWSLNAEEVYLNQATAAEGLADSEAEVKLKQYGANELPEPPQRSLLLQQGNNNAYCQELIPLIKENFGYLKLFCSSVISFNIYY
ncbi:cation-transporting P-type ATPase [Myxosarcina sp. GI1]|uniref:cation-transporting P-type ATPase n=1 Tax=Myxosarcina sp. GI1 TaxID=1541065 RepID=UPI0005662F64|nr:cation-transporting P-type ATPase [Myxosarcina sp. GI1]